MSKPDRNAIKKKRYLEYYRELPVQQLAAGHAGVSDDTVLRWRDADAEFAEQVLNAKSEWALKNAKAVKSREWLLERVLKSHFAPRTEHTGESGEPIQIEIVDSRPPKE